MIVAAVKETFPGERRVALVPASIAPLVKLGCEVLVETGAGLAAGFPDQAYAEKGAKIVSRAEALAADCLLQVRALGANPVAGAADLPLLHAGQVVIGMCDPLGMPGRGSSCWPKRGHAVLARARAADHAGAEHGRAQLAGHDRRLSGRAAGGHDAWARCFR